MSPEETVMLAAYVHAQCPQQRFDEYTPDAWHDVLHPYTLAEARIAVATRISAGHAFVAVGEIITEIRRARRERAKDFQGPGLAAQVPDADPDDVHAYLAALRQQRYRAAAPAAVEPHEVQPLLGTVGRRVPDRQPR
ncbi:hypothetical protein T261_5805 [Streptomyces lydicus]|nr:hypothetical protein T261_5805 [Streptomyces lydicus]